MRALFVVVSGAPGSGKSTLARQLAPRLGLPLFMKDTIKEALADVLGAEDVPASQLLGAATMQALMALARDNSGAVIESTWVAEWARTQLVGVEPLIEVFCEAPSEVLRQRIYDRAPDRHPVHFDRERVLPNANVWAEPIGGDWPLVRVDTTKPVDIDGLAGEITRRCGTTL